MKIVLSLALVICSLASPARADNSSLTRAADTLSHLARTQGDRLSPQDRTYVENQLLGLIGVFRQNGGGHHHRPRPIQPTLICDSNDNTLRNLDGGQMLYDFNDAASCQEAKQNVLQGKPFCDYNDNTLRSTDGKMIYDFSDSPTCKDAIERVYEGRNFCDFNDNTLRRPDGSMMYDFSSSEDCRKALN